MSTQADILALGIQATDILEKASDTGKIYHIKAGDTGAQAVELAPQAALAAEVIRATAAENARHARVHQTFSNAAATVAAGTTILSQTGTMSASRAVTLPLASSVPAGFALIVQDDSGTVTAANNITFVLAGADTTNVTPIGGAGGRRIIISDGVSKWTADGGIVRVNSLPRVLAFKSVAQNNLTAGVYTLVLFETEEHDTHNRFASSTFTADRDCFVAVEVVLYKSAGGSTDTIGIFRNNSEHKRIFKQSTAVDGQISCSHTVYCANGQTLDIRIFPGATTSIAAGATITFASFVVLP